MAARRKGRFLGREERLEERGEFFQDLRVRKGEKKCVRSQLAGRKGRTVSPKRKSSPSGKRDYYSYTELGRKREEGGEKSPHYSSNLVPNESGDILIALGGEKGVLLLFAEKGRGGRGEQRCNLKSRRDERIPHVHLPFKRQRREGGGESKTSLKGREEKGGSRRKRTN